MISQNVQLFCLNIRRVRIFLIVVAIPQQKNSIIDNSLTLMSLEDIYQLNFELIKIHAPKWIRLN